MKIKLIVALFIATLTTLSSAYAEQENLYTSKGFPYKNLVERSNVVKIIYSENSDAVTCRVEVDVKGRKWTSAAVQVNKKTFNELPLSSCLSRQQAKNILAGTYNS